MTDYLPPEQARENVLAIAQNVKARIRIRAKLYGLPIPENDIDFMIVAAFFEGADEGRKEARATRAEQDKRAAQDSPEVSRDKVTPPPAKRPSGKRPVKS